MRKALLIVDMQNDFLTGSLVVPGGIDLVDPIIEHAAKYDLVYYSFCWHPRDHCSFQEFGGQWPPHCIQGSWGAKLEERIEKAAFRFGWQPVIKGSRIDREEYSAFANDRFVRDLEAKKVELLRLCGVARNVCVADTERDAKKHVGIVEVVEELCKAV